MSPAEKTAASLQAPGATADEWFAFTTLHGLGDDLVPVVADRTLQVKGSSHLKSSQIGKVPSVIERDCVVGLAAWPKRRTTQAEVDHWSSDPRMGFGVITREVRACDIDLEDASQVRRVQSIARSVLGIDLPVRSRAGSARVLLVARVPGTWRKMKVQVDEAQAVEFLGDLQMFVACGQHKDGARYAWSGLDGGIPTVSAEHWRAFQHAVAAEFKAEHSDGLVVDDATVHEQKAVPLTDEQVADTRAALAYLAEVNPAPGYDVWVNIGQACKGMGDVGFDLFIEYSELLDNGDVEEAAMKWPMLGGSRSGHAAIIKRAMVAGWTNPRKAPAPSADGFGDVEGAFDDSLPTRGALMAAPSTEASVTAGVDGRDLPPFVRHKNGSILATIGNALMALRRPDVCGWLIGRDTFRDELMRSSDNGKTWQPMVDEDMVLMREFLEHDANGFAPIAKETMRDAVGTAALQHCFDSAQLWLKSLPPWDGTPRVTRFMAAYAGAADTPYTWAVGNYLWTALAGRVLQPGVKADMVPVLVGKQGVRKSSLVAAMVPDPMHHAELSLDEKEDDLARKMKGKLVGEFGELTGLRKKEVDALKSFVARTKETWVPKFKELTTTYDRRIVFVGTTNAEEFLTDETGNRRWLPVRVESRCDPDKMRKHLEQLWAEGAAMFLEHGVMWQDAEKLARGELDAFVEIDAWGPPIEAWLRRVARSDPSGMSMEFDASHGFTSHDVALGALGFHARDINRATEIRIGRVMTDLACPKERVRKGGVRTYVYQLPANFTGTGGGAA